MKYLGDILSRARPYTFILSISLHMLIFSIPVSMVIKPQIQDIELFVSIEDIRVTPEQVKTQMELKKPRPEPVKEANIQMESPRPQIIETEIIKPDKEDNVGPIREVKKEPEEEVKDEPIRIKLNSTDKAEPVKEVKREQRDKIPMNLESFSVNRPETEGKETLIVPLESNILERNTIVPIVDGEREKRLMVENKPSVSHNVGGIEPGSPVETRFGDSIAPSFLHREMPVYPIIARRLGKEGKVTLRLSIDENGNLLNVEVLEKAGYGFTEAAIEAVKKSTFLPAKKDGKPVASRALLTIRFKLERN